MQKTVWNVCILPTEPNHAIKPTPTLSNTAWPPNCLPALLLLIPCPHLVLQKVLSPKWEGNWICRYGFTRNIYTFGSKLFGFVCSWVRENGVSPVAFWGSASYSALLQGPSVLVSCCRPAGPREYAFVVCISIRLCSLFQSHGCFGGHFQGSHLERGCGSLASQGICLSFSWPCTGAWLLCCLPTHMLVFSLTLGLCLPDVLGTGPQSPLLGGIWARFWASQAGTRVVWPLCWGTSPRLLPLGSKHGRQPCFCVL